MKHAKRILTFVCALALMLSLQVTALAADALSISDARTGIVQVKLVYVDQAGNENTIKTGTAFLIDEQYAITNYHVTHLTEEQKQEATELYGVDFVNTTVSGLKLFVVVRRDMTIETTELNGSEESDFSILRLSQSLKDRTYLPLGEGTDVAEAETVYALGFPELADAFTDAQYYTSEDVNISSGIVNKKITENGVPYIQHSAELSDGNSGGPLLNEDGVVVGVNRFTITYENDQSVVYNRSIDISEIKTYLNSLGVPYQNADAQTQQPVQEPVVSETESSAAEPAPEVTDEGNNSAELQTPPETDMSQLENLISRASGLDTVGYTKESVDAVESALIDARNVQSDSNATQADIDRAADNLNNAIRGLEEKAGVPVLLIAGIAAVVIMILVIVVIVVAVSSSKKKKKLEAARDQARRMAVPPMGGPVSQPMNMQQPPRQVPPVAPYQAPPMPPVSPTEGAGETSLLNSGAGETTLLGGQGRSAASLVRIKTGETVSISKQVFTIGKERRKVDFCISDNNSISRAHAQILCRGTEYFIVDQNSTNFTFVNGNRIDPRQEVRLKNGDRIKLADEEFEFKSF